MVIEAIIVAVNAIIVVVEAITTGVDTSRPSLWRENEERGIPCRHKDIDRALVGSHVRTRPHVACLMDVRMCVCVCVCVCVCAGRKGEMAQG